MTELTNAQATVRASEFAVTNATLCKADVPAKVRALILKEAEGAVASDPASSLTRAARAFMGREMPGVLGAYERALRGEDTITKAETPAMSAEDEYASRVAELQVAGVRRQEAIAKVLADPDLFARLRDERSAAARELDGSHSLRGVFNTVIEKRLVAERWPGETYDAALTRLLNEPAVREVYKSLRFAESRSLPAARGVAAILALHEDPRRREQLRKAFDAVLPAEVIRKAEAIEKSAAGGERVAVRKV